MLFKLISLCMALFPHLTQILSLESRRPAAAYATLSEPDPPSAWWRYTVDRNAIGESLINCLLLRLAPVLAGTASNAHWYLAPLCPQPSARPPLLAVSWL
jgi:hypothetical protein